MKTITITKTIQSLRTRIHAFYESTCRSGDRRYEVACAALPKSLPHSPVDRCLALLRALEQQLRQHDESRQDV